MDKNEVQKKIEMIFEEINIQIKHHQEANNVTAANSLYHIRSVVNKHFPQIIISVNPKIGESDGDV